MIMASIEYLTANRVFHVCQATRSSHFTLNTYHAVQQWGGGCILHALHDINPQALQPPKASELGTLKPFASVQEKNLHRGT